MLRALAFPKGLQQDEGLKADSVGQAFAYRAGWSAILIATPVAAVTLISSGMRLQAVGVELLFAMLGMLCVAHVFYKTLRPSRPLSLTSGILAMMILGSVLAAIISHAGLRLGRPWIDQMLSDIDMMMGIDTARLSILLAVDSGCGALLDFFYSTTMQAVYLTAIWLGLKGQEERLWELGYCYVACILLASVISIMAPAIGSMVYHQVDGVRGLPAGAGNFHLGAVEYFRSSSNPVFDWTKIKGIVTFPSFHLVMALMVPRAFRGHRWMFSLAVVWSAIVIVSTVGVGGHYVIDLVGGAVMWGACILTIQACPNPLRSVDDVQQARPAAPPEPA